MKRGVLLTGYIHNIIICQIRMVRFGFLALERYLQQHPGQRSFWKLHTGEEFYDVGRDR